MLYTENNTDFACYIFQNSATNFNDFWQNIAVVFELSSAYLIIIYHVRLLLRP